MTRIGVNKTYKLFIGGEFPRSESGRSYPVLDSDGDVVARVAQASRKDLRMAVRSARSAQSSWAARSAYNRGQILYRLAEMIEDRAHTYVDQLSFGGLSTRDATNEVAEAIDTVVWYAGWTDKFAQVYGNLNPVAGPFFNISAPEPTGVVGVVAPAQPALHGLVSRMVPPLVLGNTVVVVASEEQPLPAITLGEAMATSDIPGGVINILTGSPDEIVPHLAGHMDVNAIDVSGAAHDLATKAAELGADNVKRVVSGRAIEDKSPYFIADFSETKTVWHPKGL